MRNENNHISDAELLQFVDGEMSSWHASRIQKHVTSCWQCRARRAEFERAISDYVQVHPDVHGNDDQLPANDGPRARLLARLIQLAAARPSVPVLQRSWQPLAFGGAALSLVLALGVVFYFSVQRAGAASIPDGQLTPGATRSVTRDDVCSHNVPQGFYPIPATVAFRVFEKYRIQNPRPRSYEVDYLITPALGGAEDIRNLWPQPYATGEWNSHVKDALEHHLHDLVCAGELDLETAQRDIASNWIAAYRKYFNTNRPLADHTDFSADPPWEN